jgi:hypothetical protein
VPAFSLPDGFDKAVDPAEELLALVVYRRNAVRQVFCPLHVLPASSPVSSMQQKNGWYRNVLFQHSAEKLCQITAVLLTGSFPL